MTTYNASEARASFFKIMDEVALSHKPVHVKGKRNEVVIMAEEDYAAMRETLYLLSIPGMREELIQARAEPLDTCAKKLDW